MDRYPQGSTRAMGDANEMLAAHKIVEDGGQLVGKNIVSAGVEIDLIARWPHAQGYWLYVFVEVRSRSNKDRGSAIQTVGQAKQRRLIRGATMWLVENDLWEKVAVRFDVFGIDGVGLQQTITWVRNAFESDESE